MAIDPKMWLWKSMLFKFVHKKGVDCTSLLFVHNKGLDWILMIFRVRESKNYGVLLALAS